MVQSSLDEQIRDANTRYHDAAAADYDAKWGIDWGDVAVDQVETKFVKALGRKPSQPFAHALEIGAGTGYFGLNLIRAGLIDRLSATDISAGMVQTLLANAQRLGFTDVTAVKAQAEVLPFPDASFDLVCGHAVLHHLPDLAAAFAEFRRVLKPGGVIVFAGEPSRVGDEIANVPKQLSQLAAPLWRRLLHAPAAVPESDPETAAEIGLEGQVDVHVFTPSELRELAQGAGLTAVRVGGEELLANWFGWFNRGLEATARPDAIPLLWRRYAFHGYLALQQLDRHALEPVLPAALFYNLLLSAQRPLIEEASAA